MQKTIRKIFTTPTIRLKTLVIFEILILLLVSLGALFYFTRKSLVMEAKKDAQHRLEATVQHVDNILLSVEQTAGNFYYELLEHLDEPERMATYCRRIIECNPNISGCAIAFKPGYYPSREDCFTYIRRKKYNSPELVLSDRAVRTPYVKQSWYRETMQTGKPAWIDPGQNKDRNLEPTITFSLPLRDRNGVCVGVMSVGLSIDLLSQIVLHEKPTPHSYSVLLAQDGTYIIHHDRNKLAGQKVFTQPDVASSPRAMIAAKAMVIGATGDMSFPLNGTTWYIFYKPFVRTNVPGRYMEHLSWSIATIYPKEDIFGEYNHLVFHVLGISLLGLLVFYFLCRIVIRRQLRPLVQITEVAESLAEGNYDDTIPETKRDDEVGFFQYHFHHMQQALAADVRQREELNATLRERREKLQDIHREIQENDVVKTTFLHNVTNRMIAPAQAILDTVNRLCENIEDVTYEEASAAVNTVKQQGDTILELLSHKFNASKDGADKEVTHE